MSAMQVDSLSFRWTGPDLGWAVQVAVLSARIGQLTTHLQQHRKDHSTTRGLYQLLGRRKRLLLYLYNTQRCVDGFST